MKEFLEKLLDKLNLRLRDDWAQLHTFVGTWVLIVIGSSGDAYNIINNSGIIGQGKLPQNFLFILHLLSVFGLLAKVFKQKLKDAGIVAAPNLAAQSDSDEPKA